MDLKTAIQELNALRIAVTDTKTLQFLDKWSMLLLEISAFKLTEVEKDVIHAELDVYLTKFRENELNSSLVKTSLKSFLYTVKQQLRIKDHYKYTLIGVMVALLLSIPLRIHFVLCCVLGLIIGWIIDQHLNSKQRHIRVNLDNLW